MRKHRIVSFVAALLVLLALAVSPTRNAQEESMALAGGIKDVPANENNLHLQELARFAVDEHNKKAVSPLPLFSVPLLCDVPGFCCVVVRCSRL